MAVSSRLPAPPARGLLPRMPPPVLPTSLPVERLPRRLAPGVRAVSGSTGTGGSPVPRRPPAPADAAPVAPPSPASSAASSASSAIDFLTLCHRLKTTKRKGWINHSIKGPESIADHMYRMALMALIAGDLPAVDRERCIKIAIVHDIAEAIVGDITPSDGIPKAEKSCLRFDCHPLGRRILPSSCSCCGRRREQPPNPPIPAGDVRHPSMAQPPPSSQGAVNPLAPEQRVVVTNRHGEKLVGLLHHMGTNKIVVLCHGFTASKNDSIIIDLAAALTKQGISIFHFDFSGNGESEGEFQYGNYRKEADDLHSVVSYLSDEKYDVTAIVGHSKGGDVVVLYASIYDDVRMVVNISGRFYLEKGIEERLGKEFIDRINKEGYIEAKNMSGKVLYRVTKESLMERLNTDMRAASLSISKECRFFTVHGTADNIIPVEDAYEFAKHIPNHKLRVIEGADHCYTAHRKELSDAVVDFITSNEAGDTSLAKDE